jgi:hypothetical protein
MYVSSDGKSWELRARDGKLNRDATATPELGHTRAPLATDLWSVDLFHRREMFGGILEGGLGFESRATASVSSRDDEWRVMAEWVRDF